MHDGNLEYIESMKYNKKKNTFNSEGFTCLGVFKYDPYKDSSFCYV